MDDSTPRKLKISPDHFTVPTPTATEASQDHSSSPSTSHPKEDNISLRSLSQSQSSTRRKLKRAALMLNLFSLRRLPWVSV
ncbi:unnamed protein product [Eruca vesicaria subsp. sativa]|uniref:Uncharacterized protein n=1 Tax=Eruca vesicaria subsp. sativa TaxID=29727 RepID=A0ABC8IWN9_ERUVS|nr:unnamed protein product [Eruca vesicaria subsp. sativa]